MEKIEYNYDFHRYYSLKVSKDKYIGNGLSGIINQGNKCFMSAILQCLSNTMSLTDYILSSKIKEDIPKRSDDPKRYVLASYIQLIQQLWNENQIIRPKSFLENFSIIHKKYFSMEQQDAHECLLYLLDILHITTSYPIEVEIKGDPQTDTDVLMKMSLETWKSFYENSYSYIIELFNGSTINRIKCSSCGETDIKFESYNTLNLDIASKNNIYECLDNYFNNEIVDNWHCEKCKITSQCNKTCKAWTFPDYVIINLKRGTHIKDSHLVDYPLKDLNLTGYTEQTKINYIYDLYAICNHSGNLNGGHYYASCKNMDENWYEFNDANVSKFNNTFNLVTSEATILFYQRKKIYKKEALLI